MRKGFRGKREYNAKDTRSRRSRRESAAASLTSQRLRGKGSRVSEEEEKKRRGISCPGHNRHPPPPSSALPDFGSPDRRLFSLPHRRLRAGGRERERD